LGKRLFCCDFLLGTEADRSDPNWRKGIAALRASTLFQDLMFSLFERSRPGSYADKKSPINELCQELLTERGEISGYAYSQAILDRYSAMEDDEKLTFFRYLNVELDIDDSRLVELATAYESDPSPVNFRELTKVCEPRRRGLLDRINQLPGATEQLVAMRADLLRLCRTDPALKKTDQDFQHMFRTWFNRGFLVLRQINWDTPANVLEKIIEYEAVHAIGDWDDLRRRVQPEDRRCFAFFHPSIPEDPLIFVEVAICKGIPGSIQQLLSEDRVATPNSRADTATFYSISNCQSGLAGISFGNSLIKQVVRDLSIELPNLENFVTLSPLPGFSKWLAARSGNDAEGEQDAVAARLLQARDAVLENGDNEALSDEVANLRILAARYLASEKRDDGFPLDPVARFHLSNGALIHDLHGGADTSDNGLKQSCGVMANYLYDLRKVEKNHEDFVREGIINASRKMETLAKQKPA